MGLSVEESSYYLRDSGVGLRSWFLEVDVYTWIQYLCSVFLYPSATKGYTLDLRTNQLRLHFPLMANFRGLQCPRFISHSHFIEHWLQLCDPSPHSRTPSYRQPISGTQRCLGIEKEAGVNPWWLLKCWDVTHVTFSDFKGLGQHGKKYSPLVQKGWEGSSYSHNKTNSHRLSLII